MARERFAVDCHEKTIGRVLRQLGFSDVSARPRHPENDEQVAEALKNAWPALGLQAASL